MHSLISVTTPRASCRLGACYVCGDRRQQTFQVPRTELSRWRLRKSADKEVGVSGQHTVCPAEASRGTDLVPGLIVSISAGTAGR